MNINSKYKPNLIIRYYVLQKICNVKWISNLQDILKNQLYEHQKKFMINSIENTIKSDLMQINLKKSYSIMYINKLSRKKQRKYLRQLDKNYEN